MPTPVNVNVAGLLVRSIDPLPAADLADDTVVFYWVDPGEKTVRIDAKIDGVATNKTTTFNVQRPDAALTTTTSAFEQRGPIIQFGHVGIDVVLAGEEDVPGIKFHGVVDPFSEPAGELKYLQVIASAERYMTTLNGQPYRSLRYNVLDQIDDAPSAVYDVGGHTDDSPEFRSHVFTAFVAANPLFNSEAAGFFSQEFHFEMNLMWQSNKPQSIMVPLRKVEWYIAFDASSPNGTDWTLGSSSHSVHPASIDTTSFPTWSGRFQDDLQEVWENDD
jgi:hypothetical protein